LNFLEKVIMKKELFEIPNPTTPSGLLKVIKMATKKDPKQRITISEAVSILEKEFNELDEKFSNNIIQKYIDE